MRLAASAMRNVAHDRRKNKAVSKRGKSEILVSLVTYIFLCYQGSLHNKTIPLNTCNFRLRKPEIKLLGLECSINNESFNIIIINEIIHYWFYIICELVVLNCIQPLNTTYHLKKSLLSIF